MDSEINTEINGVKRTPVWAQLVSDVFSPLLVPTFAIVVAMWCTDLRNIPEYNRVIATAMVALITGAMPLLTIFGLIKLKRVDSTAIPKASQRFVPMAVGITCYVLTAVLMRRLGAPSWLTFFFVGAAAAAFVAALITTVWKISAHATGIGGLLGLTAWCSVYGLVDINAMIVLTTVILITGLVGTARLMLERHTLGQVIAGYALGFAAAFGFMYL